jgi:hypothetical protein
LQMSNENSMESPLVYKLTAISKNIFRLAINNILNKLYAQSGEGEQFFVGAERNMFFDIAVNL